MPPQPNINNKELQNTNSDDCLNNSQFVFVDGGSMDEDLTSDNETEATQHEIESSQYAGYQLLQQDDMTNREDSNDSDEDVQIKESFFDNKATNEELLTETQNDQIQINYNNLQCNALDDELPSAGLGFPVDDSAEDALTTSVLGSENIELSPNQIELVKTAMCGFTLPTMNIPDWAKNMSDEEWKNSILDSVKSTTKK